MKLKKEIKIALTIAEESVLFTLRKPTNEELNEFLGERYEVEKKGKLKDKSLTARVALFDTLLTGVENLTDENDNPIGPDRKAEIPANWKGSVIFKAFEDMEIDEKN